MSREGVMLSSLAIIFVCLAAGWLFRRIQESGRVPLNQAQFDGLRHFLQSIAIFFFMPLAAMLSLWGLKHPDARLLGVPLLGFMSYIAGGGLALLAARVLKMDRKQTGSFFCCGTFTNIGAIGGLVCLLYIGEETIALVVLYRLVEELYFFGVAFPVAQWFAREREDGSGLGRFRLGPAVYLIVLALLSGIALNLCGVARPAFLGSIAALAIVLCTVSLLFAIGMTLRFSRVGDYKAAALVMCAIKFIGVPLIVASVAIWAGYGRDGGEILRAVVILAAMPIAMTALVPPALFGLDVDLANSCWIVTTAGLIVVLPALVLILPLL
ncbi:MAG: hypothetical protein HDQ44_00880 [Desulfovibrio sp.]|nr:hypothetical protein [Desulfovibrio sp.]